MSVTITPSERRAESARIVLAVREFIARRYRLHHPVGSFDRKSLWYPDAAERQYCCDSIRYPTRAWPYSLMAHCRSARHVAALYDVDVWALRKAARR